MEIHKKERQHQTKRMLSKSLLLFFIIGLSLTSSALSQETAPATNISNVTTTENATKPEAVLSGNSSSSQPVSQETPNTPLATNATSEPTSQNATSEFILQESLAPLNVRPITLLAGKPLAIPLSYPRSGMLVITLAEYEGAAIFTLVSNLTEEAIQNPLIASSSLSNKYFSRTLQVKGDSGAQVYLLLKQAPELEKANLKTILTLKTSFIGGSMSPLDVFSIPKEINVEWTWDPKTSTISAAWPSLVKDSNNYTVLANELSKSDQALIEYRLIGTINPGLTWGTAMFNSRLDGHTGLVKGSVNTTINNELKKVSFNFHPAEQQYYFTVIITVSKVAWNNHSNKAWEVEYVYPMTEYKVPAEYVAAYQKTQVKENPDKEIPVIKPAPKNKTGGMQFLTPFTMFAMMAVVLLLLVVIIKVRQSVGSSPARTERPRARVVCEDDEAGYVEMKSTRFARYNV